MIIPITRFVITPTCNSMITTNGNSKKMIIGNLLKSRINRITITSIKTYTTMMKSCRYNIWYISIDTLID